MKRRSGVGPPVEEQVEGRNEVVGSRFQTVELKRSGKIGFQGKRHPSSGIGKQRMWGVAVDFSAVQRHGLQVLKDSGKDLHIRITFRQGDPDFAHGDAELCADFEKLQADRLTLRVCKIGIF